MWHLFCPEAIQAFNDPETFKNKILQKRILKKLQKPNKTLEDLLRNLFLNVLITLKITNLQIYHLMYKMASKHFSTKQSYWYDHPIQWM